MGDNAIHVRLLMGTSAPDRVMGRIVPSHSTEYRSVSGYTASFADGWMSAGGPYYIAPVVESNALVAIPVDGTVQK